MFLFFPSAESPLGMKIKLSKSGDAEIIPTETQKMKDKHEKSEEQPKQNESPLGKDTFLLFTY